MVALPLHWGKFETVGKTWVTISFLYLTYTLPGVRSGVTFYVIRLTVSLETLFMPSTTRLFPTFLSLMSLDFCIGFSFVTTAQVFVRRGILMNVAQRRPCLYNIVVKTGSTVYSKFPVETTALLIRLILHNSLFASQSEYKRWIGWKD